MVAAEGLTGEGPGSCCLMDGVLVLKMKGSGD
jgi:hypothetical protein